MSTVPSSPAPASKPAAKKPRRHLPPWATLAGAVVVIGLAWFAWTRLRPADSGIGPVITGTVKRGDLIETVSATGSIAMQTGAEVKIGSQITGTIKHLYADVGTVVKAGDLIAELNLPDVVAGLAAAKANVASARAKLVQQGQNVTLGQTTTSGDLALARAAVDASRQHLASVQGAARLQDVQTPNDIKRAEAALGQAIAAQATAQAVLTQTQVGAKLQIQSSQEAVTQALATDKKDQIDLTRQQALLDKGYVAKQVVDQAVQTASVSHSQVALAQEALTLTQQKVAADLQTSQAQLVQAGQGVIAARAALAAAKAETFTTSARNADVADAAASVAQAQASLHVAQGNLVSNSVHVQDVAQAKDAVDQTVAQAAINQADVDKTLIRTPISGTVIQLAAQQGETLAAGLSAPTLIIVADLSRMEVDAYVDETDIGKVNKGQPVAISVDAFPGQNLTGKVDKVASGSTIQQGVVTYEVTVLIDDTLRELKPDMTASVTIQTGKQTGVLLVPLVAIQVGVKGSTIGVITKPNGKTTVTSVPVTVGGSDGVNTEVLTGVTEGQTIVLAGGQSASKRPTSSSPFGTSGGGGGGPGGGRGGPGG